MERWIINSRDAGRRLDVFCMNQKHWPRSFFMKALKTKKIKVNGKKVEPSYRLSVGDEVKSFVLEKKPQTAVEFLYEDDHLLAVHKPAGVLTLDVTGQAADTMLSRVNAVLAGGGEKAYAVHRLDFQTEGVLLFAKSEAVRDLLFRLIRERKVEKSYLAVVLGRMERKKARLTHQLFKDAKKNRVYVTDEPVKGSKTAVMDYEVLAETGKLSLLRCTLHTGRTHQIRAQLAHIGHPLLGDDKYGSKEMNRSYGERRQLLCAFRITFRFGEEAGPLARLSGKSISVRRVPFVEKYFAGVKY